MSNSCFGYLTLFFKVLLYFILFMSFFYNGCEIHSCLQRLKPSLFFYVSNIIGSPLLSFRSVELFLECDFIILEQFLILFNAAVCYNQIFCSQLLNEQHNNDCHFPRANKLKCVIYTSQTTLNGIAICLFEKHRALMACLSQQSTVICAISFSAEITHQLQSSAFV